MRHWSRTVTVLAVMVLVAAGSTVGAVASHASSNSGKSAHTNVTTMYSCLLGGTLVGTTCTVTTTYGASSTTTYSCPSGATLSGTNCVTAGSSSFEPLSTDTPYPCPSGGTISGTMCYVISWYPATPTTVYYCPSGGTLSGTNCVTAGSSTPANVTTTYSCPTGVLQGANCDVMSVYAPTNLTAYFCPLGGTYSGTMCVTAGSSTPATATATYSCHPGDTLASTSCTGTPSSYPATVTFTATATANGGVTLTAASTISRAAAQAAVDAQMRSYDKRHVPRAILTPTSRTIEIGRSITLVVMVANAPSSGVATVTIYGPTPLPAEGGCATVPMKTFATKAQAKRYSVSLSPTNSTTIKTTPIETGGCFAEAAVARFPGGSVVGLPMRAASTVRVYAPTS